MPPRRRPPSTGASALQGRKEIVAAIRASMLEHAERLAEMAVAETGLGRVADKIVKNRLVIAKTPGPEDLELEAVTGDAGMMVTEFAPFGVVAAITPTTNPTSTIINNTIAIVSAGNSLVFNVHPNAKRVLRGEHPADQPRDRRGRRARRTSSRPSPEPTIESAKELMHHPDVRLLLVTGGPAVVREALKTDKRAVTAGPGNPPVVVDQTADVEKAGRDIVAGASFDNNVICTDEKTTIAVDTVADRLVRAMGQNGGYVLKEHELKRLERVIFTERAAAEPARPHQPGLDRQGRRRDPRARSESGSDGDVRLAVAEVPREHPLVWTEQMMPVMPVVRVPTVEQAIDLAVRSEHGFRHTASIHSTNVETITRMARAMNCSIFVANGPNFSRARAGRRGLLVVLDREPHG